MRLFHVQLKKSLGHSGLNGEHGQVVVNKRGEGVVAI